VGDFRVQNFKVLVNKGDAETDITLALPVRPNHTRIIKASPGNQMQILSSDSNPTPSSRDIQVGLELIDSTTVRIHTSPNKTFDAVVVFSLMEYTGATGGVNEFTVSRRAIFNPLGSNGVDLSILGFENGAAGKVTTHIVGVILDNTVGSDSPGDFLDSTLFYPMFRFISDFETMEFQQLWVGMSAHAMWVYTEQVEWVGSNWTISHPPGNLGTPSRADTIPYPFVAQTTGDFGSVENDGLWENSWIETERGVDLFTDPVLGETISHIVAHLPGIPPTLSYRVTAPTGADTSDDPTNASSFNVITNPDVKVEHQGVKLPDGGYSGLQVFDIDGPKTLQVPLTSNTTTIDAEPDRVFCLLGGEPLGLNGFVDASVQFAGGGKITWRRIKGFATFDEYIQTIQLGLEAGADGTIEDSVIRQPDISVTIKTK
jgi:hypothetical protein